MMMMMVINENNDYRNDVITKTGNWGLEIVDVERISPFVETTL